MPDFHDFKLYHYDPSLAAAILFIIFFILTTALHSYQAISTRTWYLSPLITGGFFEYIGYIGRAISSQQNPDWKLGPYIMQSLLLLLAPLFFAATIYMELGRIIRVVDGEKQCLIKLRYLTKIFVGGDAFSFLVQGSGGGIMSRGTNVTLGSNIIVAGLIIQLISFGLFIVVAVSFDRKMRKQPTVLSRDPTILWYKHLITLYVASALILIRSIFRVVEYVQGNNGYLLGHEYFLYIFDALLMLGVMIIFNIVHPSEVKAMLRGGKTLKNGFQLMQR